MAGLQKRDSKILSSCRRYPCGLWASRQWNQPGVKESTIGFCEGTAEEDRGSMGLRQGVVHGGCGLGR